MAKSESGNSFKSLMNWRTWVPSPGLIARVGVTLVVLRLIQRYAIVPYQAKIPNAIVNNWPTPV
jgi:hypothetical protein